MEQYAYLIPVFPFVAFVINILFGGLVKKKAAWISILANGVSLYFAFFAIRSVITGHASSAEWAWLTLGNVTLQFGYLLDPLSATLLFVVTIVGTLIQIYSVGYMAHDPRFSRFFAYVSLFTSAMLTLVIANNYILFFMSWEIMGLCSYLLIGFWFEKNSASDAGLKAFMTTRVGDVGFLLGIMTLFVATGHLDFASLHHIGHQPAPLLGVAALLILCGTIGKSAQFPLHVWLPDAMEGPTPVSALIHAATMVAAGVYLIARSFPLFMAFEYAAQTAAWIGTLTALMAAFIALTAVDIKKVLAYSTISQLGYMVAALGLGGLSAGTFHLMTHAFFKALLFMGAGSVIHGTGVQDIREMGGLFAKMKHTAITFLIGSLAIAGVPPLSGFFSKDEVLLSAFDSGNYLIFSLLLLTAFATAFYMFRLVFLTFFGKPRNHEIHAHESPWTMTLPLWVLAAGSALLGIPGSPWMHHWFHGFILGGHGEAEVSLNYFVMGASIAAGLGGIALAYYLYLKQTAAPAKIAERFAALYDLSVHKLWFDEIYSRFIVKPFRKWGGVLFSFDQTVVDGAVNGTGTAAVKTSAVKNWIDKYIVDGIVNLCGFYTQLISSIMRLAQTGFIQHYLLIAFISILTVLFWQLKS